MYYQNRPTVDVYYTSSLSYEGSVGAILKCAVDTHNILLFCPKTTWNKTVIVENDVDSYKLNTNMFCGLLFLKMSF